MSHSGKYQYIDVLWNELYWQYLFPILFRFKNRIMIFYE